MGDKKKGSGKDEQGGEPKLQSNRDLWFHPQAQKAFDDPRTTPDEIKEAFTHGLRAARKGKFPESAKPWKGEGPGVYELRESDASGTYRLVYFVRFEEAVWVLHVWQKKSPSGVKTASDDIDVIKKRLDWATKRHGEHYPKGKGDKGKGGK